MFSFFRDFDRSFFPMTQTSSFSALGISPEILEALATATVCGYEVNVREDKGAPEYSGTPRSSRRNGGFRNSYRGERDRSDRSGFRGNRGGFRSDRGERWGERSRRDDRKKRF